MLIDEILPTYHYRGKKTIAIHAEPDRIFQALKIVRLADIPITGFFIELRYLPARIMGKNIPLPSKTKPILEDTLDYWLLLGEKPCQELVVGTIAQLHRVFSEQEQADVHNLAEFQAFSAPDYQKYVLSFLAEKQAASNGWKVSIDHRIYATSEQARRKFSFYWLWIKPSSYFLLTRLLNAIKRIAESDRFLEGNAK